VSPKSLNFQPPFLPVLHVFLSYSPSLLGGGISDGLKKQNQIGGLKDNKII